MVSGLFVCFFPIFWRLFFFFGIAFVVAVFFLSFFLELHIFIWLVLRCHMKCGLFFDEGLNLSPLHWEHGVLTTGPPGKFLVSVFVNAK